MKKDNKLMVLKSLIIAVFLILGNTALAQHPLLGPDELHVYAFPHQLQVTIGKQANDEGRTCYKWRGYFGEDGIEERIGSKQVFDLPSYMSSAGSSYDFLLTVIGEQYYQQTVKLHIVEEITFQVQPKKGCFSGNEIPVKEDFEITTNPRGYENLVSIDNNQCQQYSDGRYLVFFKLVVAGVILDSHTVTVLNTDMMHDTTTYSVELLADIFNAIDRCVDYVCMGLSKIACGQDGIQLDIPIPYGGWSVTKGYDCCETIVPQKTLDIQSLGVRSGVHVDCNLVRPLSYIGLRAGISGGLHFDFGIRNVHVDLPKTCGPFDTEINAGYGAVSLSLGLYIKDALRGHYLSATGDVVGKFSFEPWRMKLASFYTYTYGVLDAELYIEAKLLLFSFYHENYKIKILGPKKIELGYRIDID